MLRGHVFDEQLFSSECFALFIDTFLSKHCGVIKGCNLSNSSNSITVGNGFFCVRGRFLEIVGEDTFDVGTDELFCKLICEIDLGKENTESELTQASLKIIKSSNNYPQLTQQDITAEGTIYQFEFAQFKSGKNGITEFKDTRKFLDFDSIYTKVNNETKEVIEQIKKELESVKDGSKYIMKDNIAVIYGKISLKNGTGSTNSIAFPKGFNKNNCVPIACGVSILENGEVDNYSFYSNMSTHIFEVRFNYSSDGIGTITVGTGSVISSGSTGSKSFKLVLMKLPEVDIGNYELGDINMDGTVNEEDKEILSDFLTSKRTFTDKEFKLADMNSDGTVNTVDLLLIQRKILGG